VLSVFASSSFPGEDDGFSSPVPSLAQIAFVLIVEDHPLVADSLVSCVHACDARLETVVAASLCAAVDILARRPLPLLVLTDLTLIDTKGSDAVRYLRAAAPQSPLMVFTALDDPALRREAMELGAIAYLVKSTSTQALRDEIRAVIGERSTEGRSSPPHRNALGCLLTQKQLVVLEELAAGRTNKEIAVRMNISDQTVASHMKEILGRLAVKNRTEAVIRYFRMVGKTHDSIGR
jgi:DNA-binding NarL/FixJ family response regulator